MENFNFVKFIIGLIVGAIVTWFIMDLLGFRLSDALFVAGCVLMAYSFTFMHTLLGQNAASAGSYLNRYEKVGRDMRYNNREEKGFIPESLIAALLFLIAGLVIMFIK